jgi:hypothetical protein
VTDKDVCCGYWSVNNVKTGSELGYRNVEYMNCVVFALFMKIFLRDLSIFAESFLTYYTCVKSQIYTNKWNCWCVSETRILHQTVWNIGKRLRTKSAHATRVYQPQINWTGQEMKKWREFWRKTVKLDNNQARVTEVQINFTKHLRNFRIKRRGRSNMGEPSSRKDTAM